MIIGQLDNGIITLTPDEGKILTNGEIVAEGTVYLGKFDKVENWWEIDKPDEDK